MLYRKRNIDLLVSHFALKRNLVKGKCWPGNHDYMENFQPGLAGLRFFHLIAKLIFRGRLHELDWLGRRADAVC